jgi:di/tricarboxylate transporter
MLAGTAFMILIGRRLLPYRSPVHALSGQKQEATDAKTLYALEERLALLELPAGNPLAGKTLAESRIGRALGLTILGLQRHGRKQLDIQSDSILEAGDLLLVLGRLERLEALSRKPVFIVDDYRDDSTRQLVSLETGLAELTVKEESPFLGKTIYEIEMRRHYGFYVLAVRRNEQLRRTNLQNLPLLAGDTLLLLGSRSELLAACQLPIFDGVLNTLLSESEAIQRYRLQNRLLLLRIPAESPLIGQSLLESQLGKLFGLIALGIVRERQTILAPPPDAKLQANDLLLVEGRPEELAVVRGLRGLILKRQLQLDEVQLESDAVGLVEAVLAPHSSLVGKSLRDIHFREKFRLTVLAIWRDGRAYRSELSDMPLQFGDAFLIYGPKEKFTVLSREPDFILLAEELQEAPRRDKAPLAVIIMAAVILSVFLGWLEIAIAAVAGATLMILTGCLHIEEAYRRIDWRAVFLIAGMFPLGIAMEQSGAAQYLADRVVTLVGDLGPAAILAGLFILTNVASQFMPNAVVTVLMAPVALNSAADLDISPYAFMMIVAIAASASFMSPVGHPANGLVMGPGGYRFTDYVKVGIPLTIVVLLVTLLVLPIFWPL